jgi:tellurium resistance protein TerD
MTISLSKGQKLNLSKEAPGLKKAIIGLGWDTNKYSGGNDFDLDASAFLVNESGKSSEEDFVFYGNLKHNSEAVIHTGDNRTGEGDGDDEQIIVDFEKIPSHISKIAITATIYEAMKRAQNFGQVSNAYIRLVDAETNNEILRFDLSEEYSVETALVFCEIYKKSGEWRFSAVGSGFSGGLAALCRNYGLDVDAEE